MRFAGGARSAEGAVNKIDALLCERNGLGM